MITTPPCFCELEFCKNTHQKISFPDAKQIENLTFATNAHKFRSYFNTVYCIKNKNLCFNGSVHLCVHKNNTEKSLFFL